MASRSGNNSSEIIATAGWEITPYLGLCAAKNFDSPVQEEAQSGGGLEKGIVLAPNPLSFYLPENVARPQPQNFDSPVQEGTQACGGLEKAIVLAPNPQSVNLPENAARPQPQLQPVIVQEPKTRRGRCLTKTKVVSVSYVSFNCFKSREDPVGYDFGMYEVGSAPEMEETMAGMAFYDRILPFPALLRNWKRETRQRPGGAQDKFYFHPTCKRMFRSLVEVINFIRSNNTITSNEKETNAQELQGPQLLKLSEASLHRNHKKRKYYTSIVGSESKKRRIFPVSWRTGMKTKDQSGVKEFFDDAYANLMNLPPSTHKAAIIEEDKKLSVEAFLLDARQNLLKGFQKEETKIRIHPETTAGPIRYQNGTSPREIDGEVMNGGEPSQHARQNVEPSSKTHQEGAGNIIPEPPLQQGGIGNANADNKEATMNRWTDKEMEVVEIFSRGLGGDGNVNNQQDEEDLVDYSHFLFEPDPPGLF